MITRSAFTQLNYSASSWSAPFSAWPWSGWRPPARFCSAVSAPGASGSASPPTRLGVVSYLPTLRRYNQPSYMALALPGIAVFYMAATIASAMQYWRGAGAKWKNRAYKGAA